MLPILTQIARDFSNPITLRIGTTATIGYGTLYYSIAVFAPVISADFSIGIDTFFAFAAFGLLLGGLFAPFVGRTIDRSGAKTVMSVGSIIAAAAMLIMSLAPNLWVFATGFVVLELASAMVLYEAAFAGLTQVFGQNARRHITSVTLVGGFSSTIFWPFTQYLVETYDWRGACLVFAFMHLAICLPLNWQAFSRLKKQLNTKIIDETNYQSEIVLEGHRRQRAFWYYGFSICISGFVFAIIPVNILLILMSDGVSAQTVAYVAMVIGPAQVIARIVEMAMENRFTAIATGRICLTALPLSLLVLLLPGGSMVSAICFSIVYGVSQGLANIVRGNVPLHLFGSKGYGALVGKITSIRFILNSGAPFAFAFLLTHTDIQLAIWCMFLMAFVSAAAFWMIKSPDNEQKKLPI